MRYTVFHESGRLFIDPHKNRLYSSEYKFPGPEKNQRV
jgi:hypothetical protein